MNRYVLMIAFSLLLPSLSLAQNDISVDSAKVYFKLGHRQYYPDYKDNRAAMARFVDAVSRANADSAISRVDIRAYASPDGSNAANERLAELRCNSIFEYLTGNVPVNPSLIRMQPEGVAWGELRRMVAANQEVPYRDEVLKVLDETPLWVFDAGGRVVGGRKKSLMDLRGGVPYRWIYDHIFPDLRNAVAVTLFLKADAVAEIPDVAPAEEPAETVAAEVVAVESDTVAAARETVDAGVTLDVGDGLNRKPLHRFALKTNLVYDALLMPSLEIEWLINERWSVAFEYDIAWWKNDRRHKYYQVMVFSPEAKWWFKTRSPWNGMYLGAFTGGGKYDLENGHRGYKGEGGFVGVSFGYMWSIARNLSLEAAVGAGYMYTRYKEYIPFEGHYVYQQTSRTNYFGPLKAKFAFVWRFDDINKRKK